MLRAAKRRMEEILRDHPEIREGSASLEIRTLSPQEALGDPEGRDEFPLIRGKEKLVEATYEGQVGQAFTACPSSWSGTVGEWLRLDPEDLAECPLVLSGLNALARHLGLVTEATRHCRDEGPAQCARTMEGRIRERLGEEGCLLQVGLQPAILKAAVRALGPATTAPIGTPEPRPLATGGWMRRIGSMVWIACGSGQRPPVGGPAGPHSSVTPIRGSCGTPPRGTAPGCAPAASCPRHCPRSAAPSKARTSPSWPCCTAPPWAVGWKWPCRPTTAWHCLPPRWACLK